MIRNNVKGLATRMMCRTGIKTLYTRITLTKITCAYFFIALIHCIVLVALQAVVFTEDKAAQATTSLIIKTGNATLDAFPIVQDNQLYICDSIPGQAGTSCVDSTVLQTSHLTRRDNKVQQQVKNIVHLFVEDKDLLHVTPVYNTSDPSELVGVNVTAKVHAVFLDLVCVQSFSFINDVFHDNMREDLVTLLFHIWSFILSVTAVLNESIPHLGAALASQTLVTAWSAFRIPDTIKLKGEYDKLIVHGACEGFDLLKHWSSTRMDHTIPIIIVNAVGLTALIGVSIPLLHIYAKQSFSRVGASGEVFRIYKLVLLLSVMIQLAGFFSLASTVIWIDKITNGAIKGVVPNQDLWFAAFIVTACLVLPWAILGWISIRREKRKTFIVFSLTGMMLIIIAALMFASPLYRFVFNTWPFFANVTVASFVLTVLTVLLGILCRVLGFGKGLAHFLQVQDILEGDDFTPVYFTTSEKKDTESRNSIISFTVMPDEMTSEDKTALVATLPTAPIAVALPTASERTNEILNQNNPRASAFTGVATIITSTSDIPVFNMRSESSSEFGRSVSNISLSSTYSTKSERIMKAQGPPYLDRSSLHTVLPPVPTAGSTFVGGLPANPRPRAKPPASSSMVSAGQGRKIKVGPAF